MTKEEILKELKWVLQKYDFTNWDADRAVIAIQEAKKFIEHSK